MKFRILLLTCMVIFLSGCRKKEQEAEAVASPELEILEGLVYFEERIELPDSGIVEVSLEEESRFDEPVAVIASTTTTTGGQTEWNFSLSYDPSKIKERHNYFLRARIKVADRLMFMNEDGVPVLDGFSEGPFEILVSKTSPYPKQEEDPIPDSSLTGTYWKLTKLNGKPPLTGNSDKEIHIVLQEEASIVRGFAGCNSFRAPFSVRRPAYLSFGQLMMTRMQCPSGMTTEHYFTVMMDKVQTYDIVDTILKLLDSKGTVIAEFEAVSQ